MENNNITVEHPAERIIYVEPNDIFGSVDGVPLTPDYTDLCISFDLIVEVVSRLRDNSATISKNGEDGATKKYVISWTSKYGDNEETGPNYVSFMGGENYGGKKDDPSYLTTYYVDSYYNEFKNRTIVEGLGVESLSITFETYYAPTVKIRFVDVRGASIFGREEVLHEDEVLKEDNIWGCFFTFPYPKYKLQIKGFYGRAVTYQLCCTDFRAQFNPQTGNYEIDMSFVGYDFGLLADIPLQYLIAAPYCKYADTESFWINQASTNQNWKLSDGRNPETFLYIRDKTRETLRIYSNKEEEEVGIVEIEEEIVNGERNEYLKQMKSISNIMLMNPGFKNEVDKAKVRNSTTLNPDFANPQYGQLDIKSMEDRGNEAEKHKNWFNEIAYALLILSDSYSAYKTNWPDSELSKLNTHLLYNLYNLDSERKIAEENLPKDFAKFYETLTNESANETVVRREEVRNTPKKTEISQKIWELVGLTPNIGNVFLTLYCHLETFAHMIYECAERIEGQIRRGERYLKNLGLPSSAYVDIDFGPNEKERQIDPFPAVYTFEKVDENESDKSPEAQETETSDDNVKVDAWIREVVAEGTPPWEEEMLVENIYAAAMKVIEKGETNTPKSKITSYPILPCDLNYNLPTGIASEYTPEYLAGYMSLRAAAIFGLCKLPEKSANEIGKADAVNYFTANPQKDTIQTKIFDRLTATNGDDTDILYDIALCKNNDSERYPFEIDGLRIDDKMENKNYRRQPFFIEKGGTIHYSYTTNGKEDNDTVQYIPIRLNKPWKDDIKNKLYKVIPSNGIRNDGDRIGYYIVFSNNGNDYYGSDVIYNRWTDEYIIKKRCYTIDGEPNTIVKNTECINKDIFNIFYDGVTTDYNQNIEDRYNRLKSETVNVNGYSGNSQNIFSPIVKNLWECIDDDSFRSRYYSGSTQIKQLLKTMYRDENDIKTWDPSKYMSDFVRKGVVNYDNGSFKNGDTEYSESDFFVTPLMSLKTNINCQFFKANVFTTDIYYKQNEKNGDKEEAKALLFLLAITNGMFGGDISNRPKFILSTCGKIEGIPLLLILLYGGLIWRKRKMEESYNPENKKYTDVLLYPTKDDKASILYKEVEVKEVPIFRHTDSETTSIEHGFLTNKETQKYYKLTDLTGGMLDATMTNLMVEKFKWFVDNKWPTIRDGFELSSTLNAKDFIKIAKTTNNTTDNYTNENDELEKRLNEYLTLEEYSKYKKNYAFSISGITGNCIFSIPQDGGEEYNKNVMDNLKSVYLEKVFIQKTVASFPDKNPNISFSKNTFKNYISGFLEQLETMVKSETTNSLENDTEYEDDENTRDLKRYIYMFVKNLWDRWFSGNSKKLFTAENYMANTIFMDSMYRNVYENIHINCEILLNMITDYDEKSMVFKFLSDITTKHNCMFFALPDYINLGNENDSQAEKAMETLFKPMPFSSINKIDSFNKYIVMFTHQPSQINDNNNGFKYDSFDLYSHDKDKLSILSTFKKNSMSGTSENDSEHNKQIRRYGYNIPSFGVSFGRQHNSIFKNVSVGMQNPIQTEQSIYAMAKLAEKGAGSGSKMVFYGQDLYTVFSGYAYTATVEMMGNAQIMPLMYFQLFNIPMFRGAYMIYSVTHTMKPGDMTTTVKAMKMSKHTLPYCQEWYTHYYFDSQGNVIKDSDDECAALTTGKQGSISSEQRQTENEIKNAHPQKQLKDLVGKTRYKSIYDSGAKAYIEEHLVVVQVTVKTITETKKGETFGVTKKYVIVNEELKNDVEAIFDEIYRTTDYCFSTAQFYRYPQHSEKALQDFNPPANGVSTVIGSYEYRNTSSGTMSNHAYGCAIDINPGYNEQKKYVDDKPDNNKYIRTKNHPVVRIFAKHGWGWGGSYGDFMHFSPFYGS